MTGKPPTKILFVETASAMAGVEFSTLYLAQHLDRARWAAQVVCPEEGDLPAACRAAGVAVAILPRPALRPSSLRVGQGDRRIPDPAAWAWDLGSLLVAARRYSRFLQAERPGLVITKGTLAHFYGGLAARRAGIPCIWHVQDFISERFWGLNRRVFGLLAGWLSTQVIADGGSIIRQLPLKVQAKAHVVFNGVDTAVFHPGIDGSPVRQELAIPAEAAVIGHVARLTPWKGQHHLLEAFGQIAPKFPQAYLLLVGSPLFDSNAYEQQLKKRSRELGLNERVIFAGYRRDLPQVLGAMDIFAYPSVEKDTSPLSLLSAMATGLPLVAFKIDGVCEVVEGGAEGLLVQVGNTVELARALERLLCSATLRQSLARKIHRKAVACFSLDAYVKNMQALLERIAR